MVYTGDTVGRPYVCEIGNVAVDCRKLKELKDAEKLYKTKCNEVKKAARAEKARWNDEQCKKLSVITENAKKTREVYKMICSICVGRMHFTSTTPEIALKICDTFYQSIGVLPSLIVARGDAPIKVAN